MADGPGALDKAGRVYNSSVLAGNWQEERSRAPPLKGPFMDLGVRLFEAGHARDYVPPAPGEHVFPRHRHRFGLVSMETIDEAAFAYADGLNGRPGFDLTRGVLPMTRAQILELFRTTNKDFMAQATQVRSAAAGDAAKDLHTLRHSQFAPAAGGNGGLNIDRGKLTAGIAGEILNTGPDARQNTFSQRSWMYGRDPGTYFSANPPPPREPVTHLSVPGIGLKSAEAGSKDKGSGSVIPLAEAGAAHGRYAAFSAEARSTSITATQSDMNKRAGRKVFADWPVEVRQHGKPASAGGH